MVRIGVIGFGYWGPNIVRNLRASAFFELVDQLRFVFGPITIHGHNEFSSKACPSFNVLEKWGRTFTQRPGIEEA